MRNGQNGELYRRQKRKDLVLDWIGSGLGEGEGNVMMTPRLLERYLRARTSKENWVLAVEGDGSGEENEVLYILRYPRHIKCLGLYPCVVLKREVWPRDRI